MDSGTSMRYFRGMGNGALVSGYWGRFHFNHRPAVQYALWSKEERSLKAHLSDEVHFGIGPRVMKNGFDQNRVHGGLGYAFNKQLAIGAGCTNRFQQRTSGVDYCGRDVVRFIVEHRFGRTTPKAKPEG